MASKSASTTPNTEALNALQWHLMHTALELACGLEAAIEEAPLRERANALGVMIDRLLKLQQWFEKVQGEHDEHQEEEEEKVVRVEYRYPDGSLHNAPPWANDDYEVETALPGGRVWAPFREDGGGETLDSGLRDEP